MPETKLKVVLLKSTPDPEETVSHAAKLCYSSATIDELKEKIESNDQRKFIEKLITIGHASPFEHVSFTFGVEGISRACSHQLVRHRLASYSQQSQRYVRADGNEENAEFNYIVPDSVKQAGKQEWFADRMKEMQAWYNELVNSIEGGGEKANEDARFLLPNAVETKIIISMNARELLHFFTIRCCKRAQWEIREMAVEMLRLAKTEAPTIFANAGPGCVKGGCAEGKMSCGKHDEVRKFFREM